MKSNSGKSNPSGDRGTYEFHIDNCNHLISTSLRDLSFKYKELGREQTDSIELTKKKLTEIVPGEEEILK
jgi:hypothetical protein